MSFPINWPVIVKNFLRASYGEPLTIDRMNGLLPERGSFRLRFATASVIVKCSSEEREWHFYQAGAPTLRQYGVEIPRLYGAFQVEGMYWLVMEDIPHAFPQHRWQADSDQIAMLARLHARTWGSELAVVDPFVPAWNEELLGKALAYVAPEKTTGIKPLLDAIWSSTERLLEPCCLLSYDPNPTNWGLRDDGTLVLYDWERVGWGTPAIDLAITMPRFGTDDDSLETRIATKYLQCWNHLAGEFPLSVEELMQQIKLAKIWTAVEFLANHATLLPAATVRVIGDVLPGKMAGFLKQLTK